MARNSSGAINAMARERNAKAAAVAVVMDEFQKRDESAAKRVAPLRLVPVAADAAIIIATVPNAAAMEKSIAQDAKARACARRARNLCSELVSP